MPVKVWMNTHTDVGPRFYESQTKFTVELHHISHISSVPAVVGSAVL